MKFVRRTSSRYSKLGRKRKKKQVWRRPTGRDNKMREKTKGHAPLVSIGYKKEKRKSILIINNLKDLDKVRKQDLVIIGKVGKKKKIELAKKIKEKKIKIYNLNAQKFLKEIEKKKKPVKKVETKPDKKDKKSKEEKK